MFESCVIGVDPGMSALGLAAIGRRNRQPVLLFAETVRTPSGLAEPLRLRLVHEAVRDAIRAYRPESIGIERIAWNTNQASAMAVARATGVVLLAAAMEDVPVAEYGPLEVKMAITGQGNASKNQVREALIRFHRLADVPNEPDAVDAAAIALCHLTESRVRRAAEVAVP
jgi:crossover junction endodeoxyribonuclease RuvC